MSSNKNDNKKATEEQIKKKETRKQRKDREKRGQKPCCRSNGNNSH